MSRTHLYALALAVAALPALATPARAQTRFVNLSDRDVFVARYTYQPYSSNSGGLAVITEEGWNFSGWHKIEPGAAYAPPAGHYYVKNDRGPLAWNNLKKSPGFVTSAKFSEFVPKEGWGRKERDLLQAGFQKVDFLEFGNGLFTISGNAYALKEKTFDFDFSSRSIEFHDRDFPVIGKVAYLSHSGEEWGAKGIAWGHAGQKAWVTLSTEGAQKKPFGPREPGYYRGKVTVHYTERR